VPVEMALRSSRRHGVVHVGCLLALEFGLALIVRPDPNPPAMLLVLSIFAGIFTAAFPARNRAKGPARAHGPNRMLLTARTSAGERTLDLRQKVSDQLQLQLNHGKGRGIMRSSGARAVPIAVSLGAGLLLGLIGPAAGKWGSPVCLAISTVFSGGWPWACYAFLVGYFRRSKIESALLASLGLTVGVVAYYAFKSSSPTTPSGIVPAGVATPDEGIASQILVWGVAAFIFGAPVGLLGNLARVSGMGGLAFRLTVPLIAFCETSMRLSTEVHQAGPIAGMTWTVVRLAACAIALTLVGHTIWNWRRGRLARNHSERSVRPYESSPPPSRR
jgi:hypothetical protein